MHMYALLGGKDTLTGTQLLLIPSRHWLQEAQELFTVSLPGVGDLKEQHPQDMPAASGTQTSHRGNSRPVVWLNWRKTRKPGH